MKKALSRNTKYINYYVLAFIILCGSTLITLGSPTSNFPVREALYLVPLIILVAICSSSQTLGTSPTRFAAFEISYSFLTGGLLSVIIQLNNSDVRGWWIFGIYYMLFVGILFAVFFVTTSKKLCAHKMYVHTFSLFILSVLSVSRFWPQHMTLPIIGHVDFFWIVLLSFITLHLTFKVFATRSHI